MPALSNEQQMVVDSVTELAENEFADTAFTWDDRPWGNLELLSDQGFLAVNFDEEYGGAGMSEFEAILITEAIGKVCPQTAKAVAEQQMVAPRTVHMFGSEEIKQEYLPPIAAGEDAMAIAMSEPQAGSDVQAMNTTVEEDGNELILNGEKIWVSSVPDSTAAVVWVKFPEGLGSVLIELDWPGVEIGEHFTNMAGHTQTQFYMEDVVVPKEYVLVRGKKAFKEQLKGLNWERTGSSIIALTQAMSALDLALEHAQDREQFGQPIADFQGIEWKLADMTKKVHAARALIYQAAQRAHEQGGVPDRLETSIAMLFTAEIAEEVVSEALQIHGANGYQQGHPLEYLYREVRGRRIGAGTDEMQKNQIASVLKQQGLPY